VARTTRGSAKISVAHGIIAIETPPVSWLRDFHGHALRSARAGHIPEGGPPKVVRDAPPGARGAFDRSNRDDSPPTRLTSAVTRACSGRAPLRSTVSRFERCGAN
jgi:hypothetical protein